MLTRLICTLLLAVGAAFATNGADTPAKPGFKIQRVAENIYAAVRTDPPGLMVDANSLFIVNDADVVVVDAPEASAEMIVALKQITDKPVRFLINTHWHDDHVIGNAVWKRAYPGLQIIGHAALRDYLPSTGIKNRKAMIGGAPEFSAQMQAQMDKGKNLQDQPISDEERTSYSSDIALVKHYMEVVPGTDVPLPDIAVTDQLILHRGARRIEIRYLGRSHTSGDLVVWLPLERIAAVGDMVVWPVPLVGNDQSHVGDWPATLDALLALKPAVVLPGHGPLLSQPTYIAQMRDLFQHINAAVRAGVARHEKLEEVRKHVDLSEQRQQFAGDSKVRSFAFGMYVIGPAVESAFLDASAAH
jgi:cyclase